MTKSKFDIVTKSDRATASCEREEKMQESEFVVGRKDKHRGNIEKTIAFRIPNVTGRV